MAVLAIPVVAFVFVWWTPTCERAFLPSAPNRSCAIAITDDTDFFQFESTAPVYALIDSLEPRVTKAVWAFDHEGHPPSRAGLSLDDAAYREWVLGEAARGHEIVLHSATARHGEREVAVNPSMPYEDPLTPGVPLRCVSSNGRVASDFVSLLRGPNVERLKEEQGVSVDLLNAAL